jgi:hypothetical protein
MGKEWEKARAKCRVKSNVISNNPRYYLSINLLSIYH